MISRGRGQNCSMLLSRHEVGFAKGLLGDWQRGKHRNSYNYMEVWEAFSAPLTAFLGHLLPACVGWKL